MVLAKILVALYTGKQETVNIFWMKKNVTITKRCHAYKAYSSTCSVKILNSFNPELQLRDIESAVKNNSIDLLPELRGCKFVATLVLEFKEIENDDKTIYNTLLQTQEQN